MKFDRMAAGLCMLAAGPIILAGMLTSVWEKDDTLAAYLQTYLVDPARSQVSAVLLHFGFLLLLPAALGLAMVTHRAPRLRAAGLVFAILGLGTLPGLLIVDFYDMALAHTLPIDQAVTVEEQVGRYAGTLVIFIPTMAGTVLSCALLGAAVWRVRFAPWWSPAALLAGLVLMAVIRAGGVVGTVIAACLLLAGLLDLGRRMLVLSLTPAPATDVDQVAASQRVG